MEKWIAGRMVNIPVFQYSNIPVFQYPINLILID